MILLGDCLERLKELEESSVDSVVTDPPYGLKFMGKKWDYKLPSIDVWREVARVLKPGGHLLSFGGTRTYHRLVVATEDAGFEIRDQIQWLYGSGFPKSHNGDHGGTALKPANEPICLARKPLEKGLTVAQNVAKWGVGGLNIDASRIEGTFKSGWSKSGSKESENTAMSGKNYSRDPKPDNPQGRWPANLILDETAAEMLDEQSGPCKTGGRNIKTDCGDAFFKVNVNTTLAPDVGSGASRFFYVAKASKRERNAGLEGMPERELENHSATFTKRMEDGVETNARAQSVRANHHPTVKPIKLMEYLIKLITPPNGIVLDPFMGSGSTGVAAFRLGFKFIGIEMNEEYVEIAKKRLEHAKAGNE